MLLALTVDKFSYRKFFYFSPDDAQKYAENLKISSLVKGKWEIKKKVIKNIEMVCLPRKHIKNVTGKITHVSSNQYLVV